MHVGWVTCLCFQRINQTMYGLTPLMCAAHRGDLDEFYSLIEVRHRHPCSLHHQTCESCVQKQKHDVSELNYWRQTVLMWACVQSQNTEQHVKEAKLIIAQECFDRWPEGLCYARKGG